VATLEFDRVNKVVRVLSPATSVTLQELYDKSQDWLDEPHQMNLPVFVTAVGKTVYDQVTGDATEIVLIFTDDWRVEFEARAGPNTEAMRITGGTITAINSFGNNPISPSAFTQVQFQAAHSGVILNAELIRKLLQNRYEVDQVTKKVRLYDDDDTSILLEADVFEDAAGTQPYRGQGIERRNRMATP
jgi:hypothetical protein